MAKAKYTKGADGYFTTKTWDGSYNQDGTKHRVTLRSKKSSADLEKQVIELKAKIRNGDAVRGSDTLFCEYAAEWLETYKAVRSTNTRKMYLNIITHHFPVLEGIRLQDIRKLHFQMLINSAIDRPAYLPADPAYLPAGHPIRNLRPPLAGKRLPDDL